MTIKECIDIVDNLKPNQYSIHDKVDWLSYLDHSIINEVILTHEGYDGRYDDFTGYSPDKLEVGLVVQSPYDRLYPAYLKMKIDEENGETARYNNSVTMFNAYLMEYKKWYNYNHMPISPADKRTLKPLNTSSMDVSEAQLEQLSKILYAKLKEDVLMAVSDDKIYAIVKNFVDNNAQMLKGKDGRVEITVSGSSAWATEIDLPANGWNGSGNLYSQVVDIDNVTSRSQVDLTPSVDQLAIFYEKDIAFVTENEDGIVTVYAIGQKPQNDYTIQVTVTEVNYG